MPFQIQTIAIDSYANVTIQNKLIQGEGKRLVAFLPGVGYTVNSPLMHYLRQTALQNGDDVLSIQYGFQVAQTEYDPQDQGKITEESQKAIKAALVKGGYEELILIGKSLGTPMAALFANQFEHAHKLILLTPIQKCHLMVEKTPTLAIIGTEDAAYDEAMTGDTEIVTWKVYEGLNHSLELSGNVIASLQVMPHIMQSCTHFLYPSPTP